MRTTTPAVDTRPSFFAFRPIRRASVVANILREKFGPGDEANLECDKRNEYWLVTRRVAGWRPTP